MNELKDTEKDTELQDVTTCTVEDLEEADIEGFNMALEQRMVEPGTNLITEEVLETMSQKEILEMVTEHALDKFKKKIAETYFDYAFTFDSETMKSTYKKTKTD